MSGISTTITGERVTTAEGGFNPTWQRHVAAYANAARLLGPGRVLDLGCGVGHSYHLLAPRDTVGVDLDPCALSGQARETHVADMRALPFPDGSFSSVLSVQSLEHVPDPERVLFETERVLANDGMAIFITPNRLTFGPPGEIIDPYHYVEFDARELKQLCSPFFPDVEVQGLFGSPAYRRFVDAEAQTVLRLLRLDRLRLRRLIPRRVKQHLYDWALTERRRRPEDGEARITMDDFSLAPGPLTECLDLVAICRKRKSVDGSTATALSRQRPAVPRSDKLVVLVMPAFNAAATLQATYEAVLPGIVDTAILVDDGSKDDTVRLARSLGLQTIAHPHNVGYGANQKTCYLEALRQNAEVVVMLHPDGQYDPGYIGQLVSAVRDDGADVVLGSRMLVSGMARAGGMPGWKRIANRFLTACENTVLRQSLSEYHTGYRAYSRRFLETVPFLRNSNDFAFDSELLVQAVQFGFKIVEIPVSTRYSNDASSVGFRVGVVYGVKTLNTLCKYALHRLGWTSRLFRA